MKVELNQTIDKYIKLMPVTLLLGMSIGGYIGTSVGEAVSKKIQNFANDRLPMKIDHNTIRVASCFTGMTIGFTTSSLAFYASCRSLNRMTVGVSFLIPITVIVSLAAVKLLEGALMLNMDYNSYPRT